MNQNTAKEIKDMICDFVIHYQEKNQTETSWRKPVVGFADANSPLFAELKEIIAPSHALPQDIISGAKTVITFFLPFGKEVIESNIPEEESSRSWDIANIETNKLIIDINQMLYDHITAKGFHSSQLPPTYNYNEEKLISDWSHKSAAYISGIGTFGVHHLLITEQGCCGRIGSVITDMDMEHTAPLNKELCLYKANGSCKKCEKRCVNNAICIDENGIHYDRYKCNEQIYDKIVPVYPQGTGDACGKCMCGVPCAFESPVK
ncbi:MAG: epoxyqueuosine reductase [Firmicutes bacterium]|nr:epoxyqueuosine reductase [Bacillota bacterium]MBQ6811214.1 epoxyqueuosine reductase [Bacillota bacterium]